MGDPEDGRRLPIGACAQGLEHLRKITRDWLDASIAEQSLDLDRKRSKSRKVNSREQPQEEPFHFGGFERPDAPAEGESGEVIEERTMGGDPPIGSLGKRGEPGHVLVCPQEPSHSWR